jgi:hypothetical protein
MNQQLSIIFSKQNSASNQAILEANKSHLSNQCRIILEAMLKGERLTTASALLKYGIGDLRRRVKDLRDNGIPVEDEFIEGRFKKYFL